LGNWVWTGTIHGLSIPQAGAVKHFSVHFHFCQVVYERFGLISVYHDMTIKNSLAGLVQAIAVPVFAHSRQPAVMIGLGRSIGIKTLERRFDFYWPGY
jgi:hypothetical protein